MDFLYILNLLTGLTGTYIWKTRISKLGPNHVALAICFIVPVPFSKFAIRNYMLFLCLTLCSLQVDDTDVINFLLSTEIIPLCLRTMEMGSELSKTVRSLQYSPHST